MSQPLFVQLLNQDELAQLTVALRSKDAFTLRRAQILLASANRQKPAEIAATFGCSDQAVRDVIHDFERRGLAVLKPRSSARTDQRPIFDGSKLVALRELLHRSPRDFDKQTSIWSLELVATVAYEQGLTPWLVSSQTIRNALRGLNVGWKRAKHWITSPDPEYAAKKNDCSG
jgi:transposase